MANRIRVLRYGSYRQRVDCYTIVRGRRSGAAICIRIVYGYCFGTGSCPKDTDCAGRCATYDRSPRGHRPGITAHARISGIIPGNILAKGRRAGNDRNREGVNGDRCIARLQLETSRDTSVKHADQVIGEYTGHIGGCRNGNAVPDGGCDREGCASVYIVRKGIWRF